MKYKQIHSWAKANHQNRLSTCFTYYRSVPCQSTTKELQSWRRILIACSSVSSMARLARVLLPWLLLWWLYHMPMTTMAIGNVTETTHRITITGRRGGYCGSGCRRLRAESCRKQARKHWATAAAYSWPSHHKWIKGKGLDVL